MKFFSKVRKLITKEGRLALRDIVLQKTTLKFARMFNGWLPFGPQTIGIEPTNRCNMKCKICARNQWGNKVACGDMTMELFNKIAPYFSEKISVSPQMFGEPLLAPHFFEMLHIMKKKHSREVVINTNGTLLNPENSYKLVKEGIDVLAISMDGIKNLKSIRGIDIETITTGIKNINDAKKELKSNKPRFMITFIAMKSNIDELPEIIEFAAENGIAGVLVEFLTVYSKELVKESLFNDSELAIHYFKLAEQKAKTADLWLSLPSFECEQKKCMQPFNSLWIAWNGDVFPCCVAPSREKSAIVVGNLNNSSIRQIWNGKEMKSLRMELLGKLPLNEYCGKCSKLNNKSQNFIRIWD